MKKEIFFFNNKALNPFFLKKAALNFLPIRGLIRYSKIKNQTWVLIDTFYNFFSLKIKKNSLLSKKNKGFNALIHSKYSIYTSTIQNKKIGNFIFLNRVSYMGQQNFKLFFNFYKKFINTQKKKHFFNWIFELKLINKFKNKICFLKKKYFKKGLISYYFNGIIIKAKPHTITLLSNLKFCLHYPLILAENATFLRSRSSFYFSALKTIYFLTKTSLKFNYYLRKRQKIKLFSFKKKLYKKDFRYKFVLIGRKKNFQHRKHWKK